MRRPKFTFTDIMSFVHFNTATAPAPAPTPAPTAPTPVTPETQNQEDFEVQVLGTRQRTVVYDPTTGNQPQQASFQAPPTAPNGNNISHQGRDNLPLNYNIQEGATNRNHPASQNNYNQGSGSTLLTQLYSTMAGPTGWNTHPFGSEGMSSYFGSGLGSNNNMIRIRGPAGTPLPFGNSTGPVPLGMGGMGGMGM
jgi:hypothetical protein